MEPPLEIRQAAATASNYAESIDFAYDNASSIGEGSEGRFTYTIPRRNLGDNYDMVSQVSYQLYDHYTPAVNYENQSTAAWMSSTVLMVSVLVGIAIGVGLAELKVSPDVTILVAIPGNVFLGLLKCLVLPMVFVILASGVANIVLMGKVSSIGSRTAGLFALFSATASTIATLNALLLKGLHGTVAAKAKAATPSVVSAMMCNNDKYMEFSTNGSVTCTIDTAGANLTDLHQANAMTWMQVEHDVLKVTGAIATWGVYEQVENIVHQLVPSNIFDNFGNGILLSVITFAIAFGAAILSGTRQANEMHAARKDPAALDKAKAIAMPSMTVIAGESKLFELINQLNQIFYYIVTRLIVFTPAAIISLVASSLSVQKNLPDTAKHVFFYVITGLSTMLFHELVFIPFAFWFLTRQNPYKWLKRMIPCIAFAFGCASSLVTLPITIRCVECTKEVSGALMRFVLTLGCTAHMNGAAIFYPTTVVFLAATSGRDLTFGTSEVIVCALVSALSSIATPPIPNGQLVMVYSVWTAVFPHESLPDTFSYVVGIVWLVDRFDTVCNILGDTYVARIVAEFVDETITGD